LLAFADGVPPAAAVSPIPPDVGLLGDDEDATELVRPEVGDEVPPDAAAVSPIPPDAGLLGVGKDATELVSLDVGAETVGILFCGSTLERTGTDVVV